MKPEGTPSSGFKAVLRYWRNSLADAERLEGALPQGLPVSLQEIELGRVGGETRRMLFAHAESPPARAEAEDRRAAVSALLCPLCARAVAEHGKASAGSPEVHPLYVPVRVEPDGTLQPPAYGEPWIPRTLLDPQQGRSLTLGTVDDVDAFLTAHSLERDGGWAAYWDFAVRLLKAVTGQDLRSFTLPGYRTGPHGFFVPDWKAGGPAKHILGLYDLLLPEPSSALPPLLDRFATPGALPPLPLLPVKAQRALAQRHLGHAMPFPLSPSQREAVHHLLKLDEGEILAVNGPPGTGKTTLLLEVIATLWVEAAVKREDPKVIVATSTNNQAVTNILKAYPRDIEECGLIAQRWLPRLHSYGLYGVSEVKPGDAKPFHEVCPGDGGFFADIETAEYQNEAEDCFLAHCARHAKQRFPNVRAATEALRSELLQVQDRIRRRLPSPFGLTLLRVLRALGERIGLRSQDQHVLLETWGDEGLDALRRRAFFLATHYWEGRWLEERAEEIRADYRDRKSPQKQLKRWRRYAKLTPCMGMTLHMLPRFFSVWQETNLPFLEAIDLLIVDEAGQVAPEVAGAAFALARKALVVGDVQQIEPVRTLPVKVDRGNLQSCGLAGTVEDCERLESLGLAASRGSVMARAQRVSRYGRPGEEGGLLLREHRRCVPEIIAYCNELAYGGRLEAKRSGLKGFPFPHLGYAQVSGRAERVRSSWRNTAEAEVLAGWIARHAGEILALYPEKGLQELVAVVTPFSAQAAEITAALKAKGLSTITVGTVHRLQGAERRIVLFSPVYDHPQRCFFDQGVNMLNVAVSRAQDSFLVFGEMSLFDPRRPDLPSGRLARHLFASPENEITDLDLPSRAGLGRVEESERLSSLEAHREALARCLDQATARVVIISPYLSDWALRLDKIPQKVKAAVARGVEVIVYADRWLYAPNGKPQRKAERALRQLLESAARVELVDRVHNKTLCLDDRQIVEGSFNWLSAVRKEGHRFQRHEISHLYRGPKVAEWIERAVAEMEERRAR